MTRFPGPPGRISEDTLLGRLVELAGVLGWRAYHVRNSRAGVIQGPGAKGFPDLVLVRAPRADCAGHILWRELKSDIGRLSSEQQAWGALLLALGEDWEVWRPRDETRAWDQLRDPCRYATDTPDSEGPPPEGRGTPRRPEA